MTQVHRPEARNPSEALKAAIERFIVSPPEHPGGACQPQQRNDTNPVASCSFTFGRRPHYTRAQQAERLLAEIGKFGDSVLLSATLLAAECGMPLSDIVALTWRDVDLDHNAIVLPSSGLNETSRLRVSERLVAELAGRRRHATADALYVFFPFVSRDEAEQRIARSFSRVCERLDITMTLSRIRYSLARVR